MTFLVKLYTEQMQSSLDAWISLTTFNMLQVSYYFRSYERNLTLGAGHLLVLMNP